MDISKPVSYRGHSLNNVVLQTGRVLQGISIESADYSGVEGVGYTEKRAGSDGIHASDVYLGARQIDLSGFVYGVSLADMFDRLHVLRASFSPTSAYQESPADKGFLPLMFFQPTGNHTDFPIDVYPDGMPLYLLARPSALPRFSINRDRQTDDGDRPTSTPWAARLLCRDPRVYIGNVSGTSGPSQVVDLSGASANTPNGVTGQAINRGDYETPLFIQLIVNTPPATDQHFVISGLNGIQMDITIKAKGPSGAAMPKTAYRWYGDDRVLQTEDISKGVGTAAPVLRMDLVNWNGKVNRPMVGAKIDPPTRPYSTTYTWSRSMALDVGSSLFWSEAFA